MTTDARRELRTLFVQTSLTGGALFWYTASHANEIPGEWVLPMIAWGAFAYLTVANVCIRSLYRSEIRQIPKSGMRWQRCSECIALTAIAAWVHSGRFAPAWVLTIIILVLPFFLISNGEGWIEQKVRKILRNARDSAESIIHEARVQFVLGIVFVIATPIVLFFYVLPVETLRRAPDVLPLVAASGALALSLTFLLVALKAAIASARALHE